MTDPDNLIEAVARSLSTTLWAIADSTCHDDCGGWEELPRYVRDKYQEAAKAAIIEMLERIMVPTDEMRITASDLGEGYELTGEQVLMLWPPLLTTLLASMKDDPDNG